MSQLCPCGSAVEYSLCCHPYVSGEKVAPDPEHLMRSRYCAFVMQDADYLIKTWHPSCGAAALRAELIAGFAHTEWLGLTVHVRSLAATIPALVVQVKNLKSAAANNG